jgi:hypothetical protein
MDTEETAVALRREADELIARTGIVALLNEYGRPHISGSYSLDLMTWRDLDIYLELAPPELGRFLELGCRIGQVLRPRKLSFTDQLNFPSTEVLSGLYWGIQTAEASSGGWKIDLWGVTPAVCAERLAHCAALERQLTPQLRGAILRIKGEVCRLPSYRKSITSQDVYDAALAGAQSSAEFWDYVNERAARVAE